MLQCRESLLQIKGWLENLLSTRLVGAMARPPHFRRRFPAVNLGREKPSLADEIDALAEDEILNEELEVLRQSMEVSVQTKEASKDV